MNSFLSLKNISIIFLTCFALTSCSLISDNNPQVEEPAINVKEEVSSQDSPLILKVKDIVTNQKGTYLEAQVQAKTDWDISLATVSFSVFKEGALVDSVVKYIKDFNLLEPANYLKEGQTVSMRLFSNSADISDYQLSLGWGQEAEVLTEQLIEISSVSLVNLGADPDCVSYECKHLYAVEAVIENSTAQPLTSIELQLSLIDIKSNTVVTEQEVSLNPIDIASKSKQPIRLRINQGFPSGLGQQLRAQLKILSSS